MHVERIATVDQFRDLRAAWNDLLTRSTADCVFLTWEWLFTWWKHFGAGRELAILVVRDGTELVALTPLALRRTRIAGVPLPSLEFLGDGLVGSDYLDVIAREDRRDEALRTLAAYLDDAGMRLDLSQVGRGRANAVTIAADLSHRGWRTVETPTSVSPFIRLAGHSWVSYLATLGPRHRANLRRRLRQAGAKFEVTFDYAQSSEERRTALQTLVRLHLARWRERGVSEAFGTPALLAFHDEVTELARQRGWLRLYVLSLDRVPVAGLYGFRYGRVFSFYQSGFDPAFARWSVGLMTMALAIRRALEEGAEEYDFLHGDEAYKFLWTHELRELSRLELYPAGPRDLVVAGTRAVTRAAKRFVRDVMQTSARAFNERPAPRPEAIPCQS